MSSASGALPLDFNLVGRPPIFSSLPPSLFLCRPLYSVHCGPLCTATLWWPHSSALRQCRAVHFLWLGRQRRAPIRSKRCLFSVSQAFPDCSISLGLGRDD